MHRFIGTVWYIYHNIVLFIEKATKHCGEDGQWFRHPESNRTWSNYTLCAVNTKEKLRVIIIYVITVQVLGVPASLRHMAPKIYSIVCMQII